MDQRSIARRDAGLRRPYPFDRERKKRVMVELARRCMSVSELARKLDVNQGNLASCISGRYLSPSLEERIAEYLGRPVQYLFPERTVAQLLAMQAAEARAKKRREGAA